VCGILGIVTADGGPIEKAGCAAAQTNERLRASLSQLGRRGPDDSGWFEAPGIALGHTRLSIMDLSPAGHQPMGNETGTVQVTFNGEIYRFWELRAELEKLGHRFRSRSDTEVIVRGYEQWGREVLGRLDGMFALAIWDARRQTLLLARDRFGKKPLFWTQRDGFLAFSSLVRPLVTSGLARPVIGREALREYLFLNYVIGPSTIFRDVEQLAPGTWLEYRRGSLARGRFWDLAAERPADPRNLQEVFEERLADAVRARLVSDAPVGLFLSGGVDSAVIAALAQREGAHRQLTFCVGFDDPSYDERPKAARVARRLGTDHHEITCKALDVPQALPALVASADHLLADQSMVPLGLLAREARGSVKVVLTGDGGDELLGGYPTYRALEIARVYQRVVPPALRRLLSRVVAAVPEGRRKMATTMLVRRFLAATPGDLARAHASWRAIWPETRIDRLLADRSDGHPPWDRYARRLVEHEGWPLVKSAVHADINTWLVDSILAKLDRATMAVGLEARSPFLDTRVAEHCFDVFLAERHNHPYKAAVRRLAAKLLGPDLAGTHKEGFQSPLGAWFAGPLRDYVRDSIAMLERTLPDVFDPAELRQVHHEHDRGGQGRALELWSLVVLAEWSRLYPGLSLA
jgi:asparagine synthase (glutamine-hydrolysing)